MSTTFKTGPGGGSESDKTADAKVFLITFFKYARTLIKNVDVEIHNEYPVPCPAEYQNEDDKGYQTDIAIIIPAYPSYNFAIEIDGKVGHNFKAHNILTKTTRDDLRDEWIFMHHKLPIFRFKLQYLTEWSRDDNYIGFLSELEFQHKKFRYGKIPKNPLIHLARKNKGVFKK